MARAMNNPAEIETERLRLRVWRDSDLSPFAALNADPEVMEHFASVLSREKSDAEAERIATHFQRHGFGFWAVEVPGVVDFAGFIGLGVPKFQAHFTPCVEIGWRLARAHWSKGYATEGAQVALRHGFEALRLDEIMSFTVSANVRSRGVIERIGMHHDSDGDFDHPNLPEGDPLRRHVLYRLARVQWQSWTRSG